MKLPNYRDVSVWLLLVGLSACSGLLTTEDPTLTWSAEQLYDEGREQLRSGNYAEAIKYFERVQARYPFGVHAQQAQLDLIHTHHLDGEPALAVAAADRFIRIHPRHPFVDYAYYMKGVVNFQRGRNSIAARIMPTDPETTDTALVQQAFSDFGELVNRFPDSRYADDARQRMIYLRNTVARYEYRIADFYYRRGAYLAAANRASQVVEKYSKTPAALDALALMTRAFLAMSLPERARDSFRVLELNAPDSPHLTELRQRLGDPRQASR